MSNSLRRCEYCKRYLDHNGQPNSQGFKNEGVRWYKTRKGYTHQGCYDLQVKKENAEPVFTAPPRIKPPPYPSFN